MTGSHRVLVVGAGGLGSPVLRLLVTSDVEHITVVDDDVVEESNLHRQTLYGSRDVGRSKIEQVQRVLRELSPTLSVRSVEGRFTPATAM